MFKFIHAADIHLDSPLLRLGQYDDAPAEVLRTATRQAVTRLVDLAIEEKVDFLADRRRPLRRRLGRRPHGPVHGQADESFRAAGIPVFVIAGNHDAASRMTQHVPLPENVVFFPHRKPETRRIEALNVAIHGQSFGKQAGDREPGQELSGAASLAISTSACCTPASTGAKGMPITPRARPTTCDPRATTTGPSATSINVRSSRPNLSSRFPAICKVDTFGKRGPKAPFWSRSTRDKTHAEFRRAGRRPLGTTPARRLSRFRRRRTARPGPRRLEPPARRQPRPAARRARGGGRRIRVPRTAHGAAREMGSRPPRDRARCRRQRDLDREGQAPHRPAPSEAILDVSDGPLAEVAQLVASYLTDDGALDELAAELKDLRDKLPAELHQGADALGIESRDWLRAIVNGIEPLLHERLGRRAAVSSGDAS